MSDRSNLRTQAMAMDGLACVWGGCDEPNEEMAHIHGIGMGGRPSADEIENVTMLCKYHHDMLDGRTETRRYEVAELLKAYVQLKRRALGFDQ